MLLPSSDFALGHVFRLHLGLGLGLCLLWRRLNSNLTLNLSQSSCLDVATVPWVSSLLSLRLGGVSLQLSPSSCRDFLRLWVFLAQVSRVPSWHGAPRKAVRHTLLYWPSFLLSVHPPRTASEVSQIAWARSLSWRSGTLRWSWMTAPWLAESFRGRSYLRIPGCVRAPQWQLKRAAFRIYCQILANLTSDWSLAIQPPPTCWWRNLPKTLPFFFL